MAVPANPAAVIQFGVVETVVVPTLREAAKPEAVTLTDVPDGPVEGAKVTVGLVMVKDTGGATSPETVLEICTVCVPGTKFKVLAPPIMKYPLKTPVVAFT